MTSDFTNNQTRAGRPCHSRRQMLKTFANGFGMLGLAGLFSAESAFGDAFSDAWRSGLLDTARDAPPISVRQPMYPARAKRVIFLFMSGGPSHVDTFDPKTKLATDNGQPLPLPQARLECNKHGN